MVRKVPFDTSSGISISPTMNTSHSTKWVQRRFNDLTLLCAAKQPLWPEDQYQNNQQHGKHTAKLRCQQSHYKNFKEADDMSNDQGAHN